jgi:uncharacterized phage infection (PIP) family protein YhgE
MTELEDIKQRINKLEQENEQLQDRVDELEQENEQLQNHVESLEEELEERAAVRWDSNEIDDMEVENAEGDKHPLGLVLSNKIGSEDLRVELEEFEAGLQGSTPTPETEKTISPNAVEPKTPLEEIISLPEEIASEQLTENQDRARFIAKDIKDYGASTGFRDGSRNYRYSLSSTDLKKVLKAAHGTSHTETVNRIMNFLDDLGKDETRIRKKRGTRKIVFEGELIDRIEEIKHVQNHSPVMAEQEG